MNNPPPCPRPLDPALSTEGLVELDKVPLFSSHLVGSLLISTLLTRSWASRAKGKPLSRKGRKGFYRRGYLVSQGRNQSFKRPFRCYDMNVFKMITLNVSRLTKPMENEEVLARHWHLGTTAMLISIALQVAFRNIKTLETTGGEIRRRREARIVGGEDALKIVNSNYHQYLARLISTMLKLILTPILIVNFDIFHISFHILHNHIDY